MKERTVTTYTYAELETDEAKQRAVEQIAHKLATDWWDSNDNDEIGESIVYALAEAFKTPGWDTYGVGDFPGIPDLSITGWDLDRGENINIKGRLSAGNAPALPWSHVTNGTVMDRYRSGNVVEWFEDDSSWPLAPDLEEVQALQQAWESAVHAALKAGRDAVEYKTSEEYARDWLEANDSEQFLEDGSLE